MPELSAWYEARRLMVDALKADLYGTPDDDLIDEGPLRRYVVGILHPRSVSDGVPLDETLGDDDDRDAGSEVDAAYDPAVSFVHTRRPSTMGLTASLHERTPAVTIEIKADRYAPAAPSAADSSLDSSWARSPFLFDDIRIPVGQEGSGVRTLCEGLELRYVIRAVKEGRRSATFVVVNTLREPKQGRSDVACWFRPSLTVRTEGGEFVDRRPESAREFMDEDELSSALLYRKQRNLAVGHGVAVEWTEAPLVEELRTTYFPIHDLALADANREDVPSLDMSALAGGDLSALHVLVAAYEMWIESRAAGSLEGLDDGLRGTAERHLTEARTAARRMRQGITLVESDLLAARAFVAMNEVMRAQRQRQEFIRSNGAVDLEAVPAVWRPFQMAFVLMNLQGLTDSADPERDLADVLWFPTGGGKTEAYLGLIAFCLVHRRLRGAGVDGRGGGVGVIMRYTLRLLTLQQFERAAGLVCALEQWRQDQPDLAPVEPFSLGLWVGQAATPNDLKQASKALRDRARGNTPEAGDPVQLLKCPWCGNRLTEKNYFIKRAAHEMVVRCPNHACAFSGERGLPVFMVDTDVYARRPSLLIGTVDKFAMLAWRGEAGNLFGRGKDATPDLIVQDELHLISGPLGTLVGLYETAVDRLATDPLTGARPKVVASTATIRRSAQQVKAVFDRTSKQFPPPGIDAGDSFFAVDASPEVKGNRQYVGVMAPSTSHATLTVRAYAALLQAGNALEVTDEVRDAYWTLLGYFGSLRVLGAAYISTIDDVRDRIKVVAQRLGQDQRATKDPRELTSRRKASEVPVELDALQTPYPSPEAPDTVLATNMISVGLDVDRLGLMVVSGQPQTTSEYIQATSRVGRRHPGLVVTLFNAGRSRDLSHYESFTTYHRSIYQQIEATGATPFAPRSLDRGLHGILVILVRHLVDGASQDDGAVSLANLSSAALDDVVQAVLSRARSIAPEEEDAVETALEQLVQNWQDAVDEGAVSKYAGWRSPQDALMVPAGTPMRDGNEELMTEIFPPSRPAWSTLTSLRNVDAESTLRLIRRRRTREVQDEG